MENLKDLETKLIGGSHILNDGYPKKGLLIYCISLVAIIKSNRLIKYTEVL